MNTKMMKAYFMIIGLSLALPVLSGPMVAEPFYPLSEDCEREIALSAAPIHLQEKAGVLILGDNGFYSIRPSTNNFTCIVNRDDPHVLKPTCFDREGTETIIPKIEFFGEQLLAGVPLIDIKKEIARRFESGEYISPRRPGVAYMLSRYNRPYNSQTGQLLFFPPHVMFYAPNLTNKDIGFDMASFRTEQSLPGIGYQGPHGYMIMISDDGTKRSRSDLPSCPAWVFAE